MCHSSLGRSMAYVGGATSAVQQKDDFQQSGVTFDCSVNVIHGVIDAKPHRKINADERAADLDIRSH